MVVKTKILGATGATTATSATEDGSTTTSTMGDNDGGTEQKIKTLIEQKDPPGQEEDVALVEAAATGAMEDKTMEDENNSDIAGNLPVDSTDTDKKSATEEGEITNEEMSKKNKTTHNKNGKIVSEEKESARAEIEKKKAFNRKKEKKKKRRWKRNG